MADPQHDDFAFYQFATGWALSRMPREEIAGLQLALDIAFPGEIAEERAAHYRRIISLGAFPAPPTPTRSARSALRT